LNKKQLNGLTRALIIMPLLGGYLSVGVAESSSVLNPEHHPKSPEYQSSLNGVVVPLDSKLSWTQRFNGDETFNNKVGLVPGLSITTAVSSHAMTMDSDPMIGMKMDVRGVVQTVRESQGKVKIKHGPIDKYGMPGMTMMFKVADAALLKGLQKGSQVDFNIDNSSGGFVITDIVPVEE